MDKIAQGLDAIPRPDFLIKSIAEQGYSLETALADLIDNSVTANANNVHVLVDSEKEPFKLFVADDGDGMSNLQLYQNMLFPSSSPEKIRKSRDLGRFGLGMKTASFSQTRKFTVISRTDEAYSYSGLTWDVDHLERTGKWKILKNTKEQINDILSEFSKLDKEFLNSSKCFSPRTIILWHGLYKFESYIQKTNRTKALNKEVVENTIEHLGIVFHRFLEKKINPLKIRINNEVVESFNPFPTDSTSIRKLEYKQRVFENDRIKLEGFILPSSSIKEERCENSLWTPSQKSLSDMEGIYIYRSNRLIIYGGWNGIIRRRPRLQLARMRVEIGNGADHLLHLNVAKSKLIIPHDLIKAFKGYIEELTIEAEKEFFNREINKVISKKSKNELTLFKKTHTNKGPILELDPEFPLTNELTKSLSKAQLNKINCIFRMINTTINKIRYTHEDSNYYECTELIDLNLSDTIKDLLDKELSPSFIKNNILSELGVDLTTLPEEIKELLEK
ncbi:ATP-binding protein [Vibrio mediterranei]